MSISDDGVDAENNTTHVENVTEEMTTNLDNSDNNDTVYDLETNQSNITYEEDINLNYTN